jgi:hypothetical protein
MHAARDKESPRMSDRSRTMGDEFRITPECGAPIPAPGAKII